MEITVHTLMRRRLKDVRLLGRYLGIRAHMGKFQTCAKVYDRIEHWRRVDGPKLYIPGKPWSSQRSADE